MLRSPRPDLEYPGQQRIRLIVIHISPDHGVQGNVFRSYTDEEPLTGLKIAAGLDRATSNANDKLSSRHVLHGSRDPRLDTDKLGDILTCRSRKYVRGCS